MTEAETPCAPLRVDKWLWHARFFKTRSRAAEVVSAGHLRLNGQRVGKPAQQIRPGDVLTFPAARRILVVRVLALSERRGPASEARLLYDDLTPPEPAIPRRRNRGRAVPAAKIVALAGFPGRGRLNDRLWAH